MIMTYILLIIGFVVLITGANWLVDGATSLGIRAKLSPLIIGLTIVAFGTSLPEMIVNVFACAKGSSGMAIGNILGSNVTNILLILGVSAMIYPIDVSRISIRRDIPVGFVATLVLAIMANELFLGTGNTIMYVEGLILFTFAALYLWLTMRKNDSYPSSVDIVETALPWWKTIVFLIIGMAGLFLGGELVSRNAQILAKSWGMSESMIGLTVVATATSLPELITSIVAAIKKNSAIAIGNVLGSNILNIFVVIGVSSLITPLKFESQLNTQLLILLIANIMLTIFIFVGKGRRISRIEGSVLLLLYIGFIVYSVMNA